MSKSKNLRLEKIVALYKQYPYFAASFRHRSHKGEKLIIEKNSYLYDIYRDMNPHITIRKSTQSGISEYAYVRSFYRASIGRRILYVFPTFELKNQNVKDRVEKSLTYTPGYSMHDISGLDKRFDNLSIKQIGKGVIAYVGSGSEVAFTSYAADDVIIDEYDLCVQDNLAMAEERQSASRDKTTLYIGNPKFVGMGTDREYNKTDKKLWFLKCPKCRAEFHPDFFEHVVMQDDDGAWIIRDRDYDIGRELRPVCKCGAVFDRYAPGHWLKFAKSDRSGYHISKMFSTLVTLPEMVNRFSEGLTDDVKMQRFYNGDLGLAYTAKGAKIDREMIIDCIDKNYLMPERSKAFCVAGVDVGSLLHVRINELLPDKKIRAVYVGSVREPEDVRELCRRYNVRCLVIDERPEGRMARKVTTYGKYYFMCSYAGKELKIDGMTKTVRIDRTESLDAVKEAIMLKSIIFPENILSIPEYADHLTAATRIFNERRQAYEWTEGSAPDHYHHAENYAHIARSIVFMVSGDKNA